MYFSVRPHAEGISLDQSMNRRNWLNRLTCEHDEGNKETKNVTKAYIFHVNVERPLATDFNLTWLNRRSRRRYQSAKFHVEWC
jgi:hypothetical protein